LRIEWELVLFTQYKQNNEVKEGKLDRACSRNGDKRHAYRILVGKPEGKGSPGISDVGW
jgi:hypothetical protein